MLKFRGSDGTFLITFILAGTGGLCEPQGLTHGPEGNLYVASGGDNADGNSCGAFGSDAILKFNGGSGEFIAPFVTSGTGKLTDPVGLVFGPDGSLFVASENNDSGLRYDRTGAFLSVVASGCTLNCALSAPIIY